MYIPLGGSAYSHLNIWPIFTFVALWHDLEFKLFAWSWLICLFFLPEILIRRFLKPKLEHLSYYRHFAAAASSISILLMIIANLVGFVVGLDGTKTIMKAIIQPQGLLFLASALVISFSSGQIMLEWRKEEERRGIKNNY